MDNPPPPPPPVPPGQPYPNQPYPGQPYPGQPYPGQPPQKGWFGRNWLWFLPVGCLSLLALIALFVGGIVFFVFGVLKSSDVYKTAVAQAKANPRVTAALGTPISEGTVLSGSINTSGDTGNANLNIPISGPKGKGTIFVTASKSGGIWYYSKMNVHVDGTGEEIDINEPSP